LLHQRLNLSPLLLEPDAVDSRYLPVSVLICLLPGLYHQALQFRTVYMIAPQQGLQVLFQAQLELFRQQLTHSSQLLRRPYRFIPWRRWLDSP